MVMMFDPHWAGVFQAAMQKTTPVIYWGQGLGRNSIGNALRIACAKRSAAIIAYSEGGRRQFVRLGFPPSSLFVAPNTIHVPNPVFDPTKRRFQFLFVGRLLKRKRVEDLLVAFQLAKPRLPNGVTTTIIGDGPMRTNLLELARNLGIAGRVSFLGRVIDPEILRSAFVHSLAYVSPGPVGLGVQHSFAHGVPVITQRNGRQAPEFEDVEDGYNGLLYDGTIPQLSDLLVLLAKQPGLSEVLGERAFEKYVNARTVKHMADGFERAIQHALT